MKKRNIILAAATTAVIGSGIAFAGNKHCRDGYGDKHGHFSEHKIERIMEKLDRHLDLTDQQEVSLKSILDDNRTAFADAHNAKKSFRLQLLKIDPSSSEYDESVAALADEFAEEVRQRTLKAADIVKQASAVLTEEQMKKAHKLIEKRMNKHG